MCFVAGSAGEPERVAKVLCDPRLWMVHACLALLGGSFQVKGLSRCSRSNSQWFSTRASGMLIFLRVLAQSIICSKVQRFVFAEGRSRCVQATLKLYHLPVVVLLC